MDPTVLILSKNRFYAETAIQRQNFSKSLDNYSLARILLHAEPG
jgi:hypothetical protein